MLLFYATVFYITDSDNLMMGLPVDNLGINNALLKRYTEFIADKVADTKISFIDNH